MSGFNAEYHRAPVGKTTDIWLTPRHIVEDLGPFDLDPCAAPEPQPWPTATKHIPSDGLNVNWEGFVWLNPPYSDAASWLSRLAHHDGGGIALIFARTETRMFFESVWPKCSGLLFIRGRLRFCRPDGEPAKFVSGAPSVLIGYGNEALSRLARSRIDGKLIACGNQP